MTPTNEDFEQRLAEALRQEASLTMTMTDTPRELRRWKDKQKHRRATVRVAIAAAAAAAIAGVVVGVTVLGNGTTQTGPAGKPHAPLASTILPPAALPSSTLIKTVPGAVNLGEYAFGAVWATGNAATAQHLYRLDPVTGDVLSDVLFSSQRQGSPPEGTPAPFRAGHVMLVPTQPVHGSSGYVVYDARGNATGQFIPATASGISAGDVNGAWVSLTDKTVGRVNASGQLVRHMRVSDTTITAIGSDGGSLWIGSLGSNDVKRIDPTTGTVIARVPIGAGAVQIVATPSSVYASTNVSNVVRIDPDTNKVTATALNGIPTNDRSWPALFVTSGGALWASPAQGALIELDPLTLRVTRGMQVYADQREGWVFGLAVTGQRAFLGDGQRGRMLSFALS